jgi:hypothetical protein
MIEIGYNLELQTPAAEVHMVFQRADPLGLETIGQVRSPKREQMESRAVDLEV